MKIKTIADREKARSLEAIAKTTLQRLNETDIERYPTNTLKDYYDILHGLMEALTSLEGMKIKGEGAHKELINHICEKYEFEESLRIFLQELREYRNRISYEGFIINSNYILQHREKLNLIIDKLTGLLRLFDK